MLECEEPDAGTRRIAANAPVSGSGGAQGMEPLASAGAVTSDLRRCRSRQSVVLPIRLIIARLPQADVPELLVG